MLCQQRPWLSTGEALPSSELQVSRVVVGPCPGELFRRRRALELALLSLISLPLMTLPSVLQEEEGIADLRQREGRLDDVGRQRDAERAAAEAALGRASMAKVVRGPVILL